MENNSKLSVTIVIPAYNTARTIAPCIEGCLAQDYPGVEIVIVDDGSTDETGHIVQRYPVRYIRQENAGPACARNRGWQTATGEVVCFTDSDCVPAPDWVSRLVEEYVLEKIAGVGGTYDIVNKGNLLAECIHEEIVQRHLKMPKYVNYLGSFNVSYRRSVLEEVEGFNETYRIASGEDNDLAYSIIKRGYKLAFTNLAQVAHYHPDNLRQYLRQQFWHGYWRIQIYRNHPDMASGDSYGGIADFLQPPLAMLTLGALLFSFLPFMAYLFFTLLVIGWGLAWLMPLAIIQRTEQKRCLYLVPVLFIRSYARGLGMTLGVIRFFIFRRLHMGEPPTEPDEVIYHN